ncbi:MAG: hypothetical protein GY755_17210 [Chloroflexi bacterium]|nr:hypothetical protein [Chloroflexota bacterium]
MDRAFRKTQCDVFASPDAFTLTGTRRGEAISFLDRRLPRRKSMLLAKT